MKFAPALLLATMVFTSVCADDTIELPALDEEPCPDGCTDVYNPVTDVDGTTYSNECKMQVAKCKREKQDWEPSTQGPFKKSPSISSRTLSASQETMKEAKKCKDRKKTKQEDKGIQSSNSDGSASDQSASQKNDSTKGSGSGPVSYCPLISCPDVYDPVTDENGVEYPNECSMNADKCKGPYEDVLDEYKRLTGKSFGASRDDDDNIKCADDCPDIVNKVCGSDGMTYSNPCELKVAACKNPEFNIVEDESACSTVTTRS